MRFEHMPRELAGRANWLLWRREKARKVPYQAEMPKRRAKTSNPATWASFDAARAAYRPRRDAGVGFALDGDGLAVIDIDGDTGSRAVDLLHDAGCRYIETSPSGDGLHGWGLFDGELPRKQGTHDGISVEIYNSARYMSVTGHAIRAEPFQYLDNLETLSKSLGCVRATQETQETQDTQETQETQETQVRVVASSFDDDALVRFIPPTIGTRNRYLFNLARHLKARMPDASKAELRDIVKNWHRLALPTIGTQDFTSSWGDFIRGWDAVRCPEGELLAEILEGVEDDPLPAGIPDDYGARSLLLVQICRRLQRHAGDEPFFLSARKAGELIGIHHTNAAATLRAMQADDLIELVERGTRKTGHASQYRMSTAKGE